MPIVHSVYFYYQNPTETEVIAAQEKAVLEELATIEGIDWIFAGGPEGVDRPVVDNTYQTSLHILFKDRAAHDAYQVHVKHKAFLEQFKPHWAQVRVFDTRA